VVPNVPKIPHIERAIFNDLCNYSEGFQMDASFWKMLFWAFDRMGQSLPRLAPVHRLFMHVTGAYL
jgi:hypothetical protein